jgi:RNA polymerase sigma factor (sigma-70 family)
VKPLTPTIRHYLTTAGSEGDQVTDADLLGRFVTNRDPVAFELLVWRHTGMVLRVCRGILGDFHMAEDACQATFLALARQGSTVGRRGSVVGWLYRVARRSAIRATRYSLPTNSTSLLDNVPTPSSLAEQDPVLIQVLHEELARLPERYRVPLLLCFFEGLTHQVAADRLGIPIGTLATQVARAKDRLCRRLSSRGFEPTASGLVIALAGGSAAARPIFVAVTTQAAVAFATGANVVPGVSESVLEMAKGAMRTMINAKYHWISGLIIACGVVLLGGWWVIGEQEPPKPPPAKAEAAQADKQLFRFNTLALDANDLADALSLNIYKFKIDIAKGQKFNVILREQDDKDAEPKVLFGFTFRRNEGEGPTILRVDFTRTDKTAGGVLLSEDKQAQLRVSCPDCTPTSFVTIVTMPLSGVKTTEKGFFVHQSEKDNTQMGQKGTRLLSIIHNVKNTTYPQAELVVEKE